MERSRRLQSWERIIKSSLDIICTVDRRGCYVNINEACKSILGYEREELIGRKLSEFVHPEDKLLTLNSVKDFFQGQKVKNFKNRGIHKNGEEVCVLWSVAWSEEDEVLLCVGRDVTELERARQKDELHKVMVEHGADMLALFDKELNFLYHSGNSSLKRLGYRPEHLIGKKALDFIHQDDHSLVRDLLHKILASDDLVGVSEFRFKNASGEWRWLETTLNNQLNNPAVKALVANSRDITDRIKSRTQLQESEQRFKSLFENHLDIVIFQDRERNIIDANPAALSFFEVHKQDVINCTLVDFLPPEVNRICEQNFQIALKGESIKFELEIPFEGKGTFIFEISKVPVEVNGKTIGVYSILRNITEASRSNKIIKQQAQKLNTIFESITDAFCTVDRNWCFTYVNSEYERLLQVDRKILIGENVWNVFPEEVNGEFYRQYFQAIETGKGVHFDAYYEKLDIWLQVKAFPSEEGLSIYLYDITEVVKSRQELEKLSLVASKTTNGVVITDPTGLVEWVNEGFTDLTGYAFSDVERKNLSSILVGEETDKTTAQKLREKRSLGESFYGEILIYKKTGEKVWLTLEVTPVRDERGELVRFISIQTDISLRKEAEENLLQLTEDLFRKNKDLQQFTYIVSHNLRSPVANAMGLLEILSSSEKDTENFALSLNYLNTCLNQLDTVLRDLNTILSIRDKKNSFDGEKVNLLSICQQVVKDYQVSLRECGGVVYLGIDERIEIKGNKAYLFSIFHNLLSNSIKYRSPNRSLKVSIRCFGSKERGYGVSISDNGTGFDMHLAGDKVFKLYKRFHSSSEGRGIGLFLIKTHLEAMGGDIKVTSQQDCGTRFLIYLK